MGSSEEAKEIDLGSGSVGRLLFKLAVPAITAQIINVLYITWWTVCTSAICPAWAPAP